MKLKSFYPTTIDIDGEPMTIGIKRLTFSEGAEMRAKLREAQNAQDRKDDTSSELSEELLKEAIVRFVRVESEVILETEDGQELPIKTGEQLMDTFGGRKEVLLEIYAAVLRQNTLTPPEKKASRSPTDSSPSSGESAKDRAGPKRETTADDAAKEISADGEDVTSLAETPSGSTDPPETPLSSTSARSSH